MMDKYFAAKKEALNFMQQGNVAAYISALLKADRLRNELLGNHHKLSL